MNELQKKIADRTAVVGIVGLGYVGLPLALTFLRKGFTVMGFDIDASKVKALRAGQSYIRHIQASDFTPFIEKEKFVPTDDFKRLSTPDAVIIAVPTPLNTTREPDLSYVEKTADAAAATLRKGQLIVLESTTWPGTTDEVVLPRLAKGGLKVGTDYYLAFSPEREDPGNPKFSTASIPKVVGGYTAECRDTAAQLYGAAVERVVPVSTTRAAELTKLLENIYRSVNIALVNELKQLCHRMDIDVHEVIGAASTKPFGYQPFYPGPGLGGHCIPIDPFYLTWKAREFEFATRFIELAGEVNSNMPAYVVARLGEALNKQKKAINGSKVLVVGIAYKKDVDDVRESPALHVIEILQQHGAEVEYHDPYIPKTHKMRHHDLGMTSVPLTPERLAAADVALVLTDHTALDWQLVVDHAKLVVDSRNIAAKVTRGKEKIFPA